MQERDFEFYTKADVAPWRKKSAFKTLDPSTREERRSDAPYRGFKGYFGLACDWAAHDGESMLRRWPCECPPCEEQAKKPRLEERYVHNPDCELEPMAEGLNDWVPVKPVEKPAGGGGDEGSGHDSDAVSDDGSEADDDDGYMVLQEATDNLTSGLQGGDHVLIDSNQDPKSAGYYVIELDSAPYDLQEELVTEDYGTLEAGRRVLDGEYLFMVFAPTGERRWYHKGEEACKVTVPTDLVAHAGFSMALASLERTPAKGSKAAQGIALGAVVLAEEDHEEAKQELATRAAEEE